MRRTLAALAAAITLGLSACGAGGQENPFADKPAAEDQAGAPAITGPTDPAAAAPAPDPDAVAGVDGVPTTDGAPAVDAAPATDDTGTPPTTGTDGADPAEPIASTPADAPSPEGTTPTDTTKRPKTLVARVQADQTAMLNARTMVSIIEGCHSGRPTYRDCNTHADLGDPSVLGLTIGEKRGEVKISATKNGFRVTANSYSGAKFTVARGPKGDRFKCIPGPQPGACPADRLWKW